MRGFFGREPEGECARNLSEGMRRDNRLTHDRPHRRPRESGDPYSVPVRFEAAAGATFFSAISTCGYGSPLSRRAVRGMIHYVAAHARFNRHEAGTFWLSRLRKDRACGFAIAF